MTQACFKGEGVLQTIAQHPKCLRIVPMTWIEGPAAIFPTDLTVSDAMAEVNERLCSDNMKVCPVAYDLNASSI